MSIRKDITVTVQGQKSIMSDDNIYIYQGDKDIDLYFTIIDNRFEFEATTVKKYNFTIRKPDGDLLPETSIVAMADNKAKLTITEDMANELSETGQYDILIHLYDEKNARITIPEISFEVKKPLMTTNVLTNSGLVSSAILDDINEKLTRLTPNGKYNRTVWQRGDLITKEKLNKIEYELEDLNNSQIDVSGQLAEKAKQSDLVIERNRIDNIVALPPTADNVETVDIRVGADGSIYSSAGEAVRRQYTGLNEDVHNIIETNSIVKTVSGRVIELTDASNLYLKSLVVENYNTDIIVSKKNMYDIEDQTVSGVTITKQSDGSFLLNGTATNGVYLKAKSGLGKGVKKTTLSYTLNKECAIYVRTRDYNNTMAKSLNTQGVLSASKTWENEDYYCEITIPVGTVLNNIIVKIQLELGAVVTPFEKSEIKRYSANEWVKIKTHKKLTYIIADDESICEVAYPIDTNEYISEYIKPWYGKKANFLGDSITFGYTPGSGSQMANPYPKQIGQILGLNVSRNYGISSTTIATKSSDPNWNTTRRPMVLRYLDMDNDADIIGCLAGINDFWLGVPLGTFESRDTDTFYGALHALYSGLIKKYPTKPIFVMTCLQANRRHPDGVTLKQWITAIKEVAEYYSIPVLDLFSTLGVNPIIQEQYDSLMPDGLHPNQLLVDRMAIRISNFIKSL